MEKLKMKHRIKIEIMKQDGVPEKHQGSFTVAKENVRQDMGENFFVRANAQTVTPGEQGFTMELAPGERVVIESPVSEEDAVFDRVNSAAIIPSSQKGNDLSADQTGKEEAEKLREQDAADEKKRQDAEAKARQNASNALNGIPPATGPTASTPNVDPANPRSNPSGAKGSDSPEIGSKTGGSK